ncbi:MAG TPA: glycosyltransferase family 39 protein [Candidatus Bathyarchaeia archaeon]|nr:glycosyltransferase family 39 protein [Candidatus Bathyarchaeia archaeon]
MKKHIRNEKLSQFEGLFLLIILIAAAFFRFRQLTGLAFFTYDQARDALYIKRIIVDGQFRLIGTQSSIPGLYTGPFYYYLMAPFLLLFRLNPVGLDFGIACFSLLSIVVFFIIAKRITGNKALILLFTSLFAFSPQIVAQSRFAWNPNPLPIFSLLFLLACQKIIGENEKKYLLLLAFSIGAAINLHYSGLTFLFITLLIYLRFRPRFKIYPTVALSFLILGLFLLPLLVFEFRHQFVNVGNIVEYFFSGTGGRIPAPAFFTGLWEKLVYLFGLLVNLPSLWIKIAAVFILVGCFWLYFNEIKTKPTFFTVTFLTLFGGVLFAAFYKGSFFFFYLTFLYPVPFLLTLLLLDRIRVKSRKVTLVFILVAGFLISKNIVALISSPIGSSKINGLVDTARFLADKIKVDEKFNLVAVYRDKDGYYYNAVDYRYFLEADCGIRVPGWDVLDYQQAQILYLISETGSLEVLKLDIWEVGLFKPEKITSVWELPAGIVIYKLTK